MNRNDKDFVVQNIRAQYTVKENTELDELRALDAKVKRPANIFAYTFGVISTLILGVGMCLSMQVIGNGKVAMIAGIIIGIIGLVCCGINYPIYKKKLEKGKAKYAYEIVQLAKEIADEE